MADFISDIKNTPYSDADIYVVLSDLNNLDLAKDIIPQDKVKEFSFDKDSCTVSVEPVGKIKFVVVDRIPNSTIKLEAEQLPFSLAMSIELEPLTEKETALKLVIKADLNPFLKTMVSKPLQQGIDKVANLLATLPYDKILDRKTE
jgi:hypothetical protein